MKTFYKWLETVNQGDEEEMEEPRQLRPGELDDQGGAYEPETQPDMAEFLWNRYRADYPNDSEAIGPETGWLLPDGRPVHMGIDGQRGEDHRGAIPSTAAMKRWGWPEEIIRQYEGSTRTPAMRELMRRAGAVRINVTGSDLSVDTESPLTAAQKRAILDYVRRHRLKFFAYTLPGGVDGYLDRPDVSQVMQILGAQ